VPRSVFVAGKPVAEALVRLPQRRLANAPLLTGSPGIAPATPRVTTVVAAAAGRGGARLAKAMQTLVRILKPREAHAASRVAALVRPAVAHTQVVRGRPAHGRIFAAARPTPPKQLHLASARRR